MGEYKGIKGGVTSMVAARFTPWHYESNKDRVRLTDGTIQSGRQALTMAGLDWEVQKESLALHMPGRPGAEDYCVLLRGDNGAVLGMGSNGDYEEATGKGRRGYQIIPNMAVADFADAVISVVDGSNIPSAGALYDPGKVVWMLVEIPEAAHYFGSDGSERFERYVLISTTHDGSGAFTVRSTSVRVQCMNTFSMAWRGQRADYTIRHTTNALEYVKQAIEGVAVCTANMQAMDAEVLRLLDQELDQFDFFTDVVPEVIGQRPQEEGRGQTVWSNKFDAIRGAYLAEHNEGIVDTAWGAVNAINEHELWGIKPRGRTVQEQQFGRLLSCAYPLTEKALAVVG